MHTLAALLFVLTPAAALAIPTHEVHERRAPQPLRITLINMSGQQREVHFANGTTRTLPLGRHTDVFARPGEFVHVMSTMDAHVDQYIAIDASSNSTPILVP